MSIGAVERWQVVFRLARNLIEFVDERAAEEGFFLRNGRPNRSKMLRLMVAYCSRHMPTGWRP